MKSALLLFSFGLLLPLFSPCQNIANGDFEDVDPENTIELPNWQQIFYWLECFPYIIPGKITNDSHSGNYAIKMKSYGCTVPGGGYTHRRSGFHTGNSGEWPPLSSSIEFNERPEELHFFYKFLKQGNDSAYVEAFLFDYDTTPGIPWSERYDTIAFNTARIGEGVDTYTYYSLPLNYVSDSLPDYISIVFSTEDDPCTLNSCIPGTTLWIDDVDVSGGTLGVREEENGIPVKIYPNPATDFFKLETYGVIKEVAMHDYLGRRLKTYNGDREEYSIADLSPGTYLVRITTEEGPVLKRFVKTE